MCKYIGYACLFEIWDSDCTGQQLQFDCTVALPQTLSWKLNLHHQRYIVDLRYSYHKFRLKVVNKLGIIDITIQQMPWTLSCESDTGGKNTRNWAAVWSWMSVGESLNDHIIRTFSNHIRVLSLFSKAAFIICANCLHIHHHHGGN